MIKVEIAKYLYVKLLNIKSILDITCNKYYLIGETVFCPICESRFKHFLPFGLNPRPNALCPKCYSLERTRLYWLYMTKNPEIFLKKLTVLHVAPELSLYKKFSENINYDYYPIDKFEDGYQYPEKTINMDITKLKFNDNYFDFILCSHVLEHVVNDMKALKEFYRVLKAGKLAILQVPIDKNREKTYEDRNIIDPEERKLKYGQSDHIRIYGNDYKNRLEEAGFKVDINNSYQLFSDYERFKYGINESEDLFIVRK